MFQIYSGIEKNLWIKRVGWGEYHDFLSEISRRTVPIKFVGEPFGVSEVFCFQKFVWIKGVGGGDCHDFLSKIFCRTVPKTFVTEPFCVSEFSGIEKVWIRRVGWGGVTRFSVGAPLSHSAEKVRRGNFS